MLNHLRASLWLLLLTLIICSGVYPLTLWAIGRMPVFRDQAEGSLITAGNGTVIGSRLIAQPFTADEYFLPRPSAASYNAMASAGSNWSANNYLLRDRVARASGPVARYGKGAEKFDKKPGDGVQADIEAWFAKDHYQGKPGIVAQWTSLHPGIAETWFKNIADKDKGQWKPDDIHAVFFDMWRQDHPDMPLEQIPADMVMASGSGLDPHITLDNARYQLSHRPIAAANADKFVMAHVEAKLRAKNLALGDLAEPDRKQIIADERKAMENKLGSDLEEKVRAEIAKILDAKAEAPLGGWVGVPLVNVLELNIAVRESMQALGEPGALATGVREGNTGR